MNLRDDRSRTLLGVVAALVVVSVGVVAGLSRGDDPASAATRMRSPVGLWVWDEAKTKRAIDEYARERVRGTAGTTSRDDSWRRMGTAWRSDELVFRADKTFEFRLTTPDGLRVSRGRWDVIPPSAVWCDVASETLNDLPQEEFVLEAHFEMVDDRLAAKASPDGIPVRLYWFRRT